MQNRSINFLNQPRDCWPPIVHTHCFYRAIHFLHLIIHLVMLTAEIRNSSNSFPFYNTSGRQIYAVGYWVIFIEIVWLYFTDVLLFTEPVVMSVSSLPLQISNWSMSCLFHLHRNSLFWIMFPRFYGNNQLIRGPHEKTSVSQNYSHVKLQRVTQKQHIQLD
jgi:hypothetical protein